MHMHMDTATHSLINPETAFDHRRIAMGRTTTGCRATSYTYRCWCRCRHHLRVQDVVIPQLIVATPITSSSSHQITRLLFVSHRPTSDRQFGTTYSWRPCSSYDCIAFLPVTFKLDKLARLKLSQIINIAYFIACAHRKPFCY